MPIPNNIKQYIADMNTARTAIVAELGRRAENGDKSLVLMPVKHDHRWHKPQDNYWAGEGRMVCPICKTGTLAYSRAVYNGHIHASCTTKGCVSFME